MRSILHHLVLASVVLAPAAMATNTAMAETIKVPFQFTVAGKSLPAGNYSVEKALSGNLVTLRSDDGSKGFSFVLGPGAPDLTDTSVTLRFDVLGRDRELQSVQYHSMITGKLDRNTKVGEHAASQLSVGR